MDGAETSSAMSRKSATGMTPKISGVCSPLGPFRVVAVVAGERGTPAKPRGDAKRGADCRRHGGRAEWSQQNGSRHDH